MQVLQFPFVHQFRSSMFHNFTILVLEYKGTQGRDFVVIVVEEESIWETCLEREGKGGPSGVGNGVPSQSLQHKCVLLMSNTTLQVTKRMRFWKRQLILLVIGLFTF